MTQTTWRKSSFTNDAGGNCVGVAFAPTRAAVRDSKHRTGPTLAFSTRAWRSFASTAAHLGSGL
jgi:hypothetical protein